MEKWREDSKWRKRRNKLHSVISLPISGSILDQSSSDGQFLELMHLSHPKLKLYGIDISKQKIDEAKKECQWGCFSEQSAYSLSFSNKTFDAIFCNMSFHHYDHPLKMLMESKRVMKDKGSIYVMDIFPKNKVSQFFYNLKGCNDDFHFEKYYTFNEINELSRICKLVIHKITLLTLFPRLMVIELKK